MKEPVLKEEQEFEEISHCGGQYTVTIKTDVESHSRYYQVGFRGSSPHAVMWGVYAIPPGIPVATMQFGGIGEPCNPPPFPNCLLVIIGTDSHGMFSHQCPMCNGYWRTTGGSPRWRMTCPYCGFRDEKHQFLTEGQLKYVETFCALINSADDGEHIIDMDVVVDAVNKGNTKPEFYYAGESQQNKFQCSICDTFNDILGRYGYCSHCGTHNGLQELKIDINSIRQRINTNEQYEIYLKDIVSVFDSFAHHIAEQLVLHIPMTSARKKEWKEKSFHNLRLCAEALKNVFDIKIFKNMNPDDIDFAILMFHRRRVYEHIGGQVDEKYIDQSGDTSVRPKQRIRETRETASRIATISLKMGKNIYEGFHNILPPEQMPLCVHSMVSLFQYAFIKGSKLPIDEQNALANRLLAEFENQESSWQANDQE